MTPSRFDRFLPLAGVLAGLTFTTFNVLTWGAPESSKAHDVTVWGAAHETRAQIGAFMLAYTAVLLAFFAAGVRKAVRSGEPGESTYSSVVFAGGVMTAVTAGSWATLILAQLSAVKEGDRAAVEALAHLTSLAWLPWLIGSVVLFISVGLGGMRTASLPRWLAIATLVLGIVGATGVGGYVLYIAMPFWLIVTGVVLHGRLGAGERDQVVAPAPARV
jgi:hypothetical protein